MIYKDGVMLWDKRDGRPEQILFWNKDEKISLEELNDFYSCLEKASLFIQKHRENKNICTCNQKAALFSMRNYFKRITSDAKNFYVKIKIGGRNHVYNARNEILNNKRNNQ